jgi:hypothetical protein
MLPCGRGAVCTNAWADSSQANRGGPAGLCEQIQCYWAAWNAMRPRIELAEDESPHFDLPDLNKTISLNYLLSRATFPQKNLLGATKTYS